MVAREVSVRAPGVALAAADGAGHPGTGQRYCLYSSARAAICQWDVFYQLKCH
ncbi:MAG: hypothetical protein BWY10_02513 [Chloroflexi bacterium ADurb.Bin180]|nr:MAG: hypothetical protein BWY10_02513 [Chloroflexi bacterium ADurb.Bin180]